MSQTNEQLVLQALNAVKELEARGNKLPAAKADLERALLTITALKEAIAQLVALDDDL